MMRLKIFTLISLLLLILVSAVPSSARYTGYVNYDIEGTWINSMKHPGGADNPGNWNYKLNREGNYLKGTVTDAKGIKRGIINGSVIGYNVVFFVVKAKVLGEERNVIYNGYVTGDEMHITFSVEGMSEGGILELHGDKAG